MMLPIICQYSSNVIRCFNACEEISVFIVVLLGTGHRRSAEYCGLRYAILSQPSAMPLPSNTVLFRFLRQIKLIIFTLIYVFGLPLFILSGIPVYIFRFLASKCKIFLRPDLGELVHSRSIVLGVDGYPSKPTWNLVVWLTQEGILDLDKFASDFKKEHVLRKDKNGNLDYPEYQQHLEKWWGFYFWRWDRSFNIKNHIRVYDGKYSDAEVIDDNTLMQIVKELTWSGWNPNRSPWEFLQIPNYKTSQYPDGEIMSILIFRIHHVLGDGYYILKLLMEDIAGLSLKTAAQPKYAEQRRKSSVAKFITATLFWLRAPYQFMKMISEARDINPWHIPENKLKRPMNIALTPKIKLKYIKEIKNLHDVTFTAVINAAVTGGIREMMLEQGIQPVDIHQTVAVPLPGHPPKLCNHFIFSFITLPVGTSDPVQRLQKLQKTLQAQRHSSLSSLNFLHVPLVGSLFPEMMGPFTTNRMTTCLMSNFPGTPVIGNFKGHDTLDMMFAAGLGPGNTGIGFTLISCADHIRLLSAADPSILESDAMVERLNQKVINELKVLKELGLQKQQDSG